jgi:hypothetical protein
MKRPIAQFSIPTMMIAVAVSGLVLTLIVAVGRRTHYGYVQREMYDALTTLQNRPPPGVSLATWECAWGWTVTAYGNVCFSEEHVTTGELLRFREDLSAELQGPITLDTLVRIWDRLSRTGPHGRRYVSRFKPEFLACLPPGSVSGGDD